MPQKRKRNDNIIDSSLAQADFYAWLTKNTIDAVVYIKRNFLSEENLSNKNRPWLAFERVWSYLSIPKNEEKQKSDFLTALCTHPRVESKKDENGNNNIRFSPPIPVMNADELLAYLAIQEDTKKVNVADLSVSWPKCIPEIERLEREHQIFVKRSKGKPRTVWLDTPDLYMKVDGDLRDLWLGIKVPENMEDVREELQATGMGATSEKKMAPIVRNKKTAECRRGQGKGVRTNVHMKGLLKAYGKS
jgi:hypothetical protein